MLAFGKLAIDGLCDAMGGKAAVKEQGSRYGLVEERHAFAGRGELRRGESTESPCCRPKALPDLADRPLAGNTVVSFVHPQNHLVGWSGERAAASAGRVFDTFAAALCVRECMAAPMVSLEAWAVHEAEGLPEGQRDFERTGQLRAAEKAEVKAGRGTVPFADLPFFAKSFLEAAGMGAAFWALPKEQRGKYISPLFAICSISGKNGNEAITRLLVEAKVAKAKTEVTLMAAQREAAEMTVEVLSCALGPWSADELHELMLLQEAVHEAEVRMEEAEEEVERRKSRERGIGGKYRLVRTTRKARALLHAMHNHAYAAGW